MKDKTAIIFRLACVAVAALIIAIGSPWLGATYANADRAPFYSSDLGWKTGQNVTQKFAILLKQTFKPGDVLVLESVYDIDAGAALQLPDGFVLRGTKGAGFDIQKTETSKDPTIYLGNIGVLENLTFTASGAPKTSYTGLNAQRGIDFDPARAVGIHDSDDVTISNTNFSGNIGQFISVFGSSGLSVTSSAFEGGRYQIMLGGDTSNIHIFRSQFKNSLADGIKTIDGNVRGIEVVESLFHSNLRDGIDTTGGFQNSTVRDSVFYKNRSAFDIKSPIHDESDLSRPNANSNITISGGYIIGSPNAIVISFRDHVGLVTEANADSFLPHNIVVKNVTFQDVGAAFLIKDGYDIRWSNLVFRNVSREAVTKNVNAPEGWARLSNQNIGGTFTRSASEPLSLEDIWNYE